MAGMHIGPACTEVASAGRITVNGRWDPYQREQVPVQQALSLSPGILATAETSATTGLRLFTMSAMDTATWMQVDLGVAGNLFYRADRPVPTEDEVLSSPVKCSPFKVRVTWTEAAGLIVGREVDIRTGQTFALPPTNQVWIDVMVPAETPDDSPTPPDFDRMAWRVATALRAKVSCSYATSGNRMTNTQTVFIAGSLGAGQQVRLPAGARSVQLLSGVTSAQATAPATTDVAAAYAAEFAVFPPGLPVPPPFDAFPSYPLPFSNPFVSDAVPVPMGAPVVRLRPGAESVARNVCVVTELDLR